MSEDVSCVSIMHFLCITACASPVDETGEFRYVIALSVKRQ